MAAAEVGLLGPPDKLAKVRCLLRGFHHSGHHLTSFDVGRGIHKGGLHHTMLLLPVPIREGKRGLHLGKVSRTDQYPEGLTCQQVFFYLRTFAGKQPSFSHLPSQLVRKPIHT